MTALMDRQRQDYEMVHGPDSWGPYQARLAELKNVWTAAEVNFAMHLRNSGKMPESKQDAAKLAGLMADYLMRVGPRWKAFVDYAAVLADTLGDSELKAMLTVTPPEPKRRRRTGQDDAPRVRRPITDPELLELRRKALEKARAARAAQRRAAAEAASTAPEHELATAFA